MSDASPKKTPKGGRTGGRQFPRISLKDAIGYSDKLVSKTHIGPQPASVVLPGVFGASSGRGQIKASALKQFGLLEGPATAYQATKLAKAIQAAVPDEKPALLAQSFFSVGIFKTLFDTFKADSVSLAKIRQQAQSLDVHPDNASACVTAFVESAEFAGLAKQNGETVQIAGASQAPSQNSDDANTEDEADPVTGIPFEPSSTPPPVATVDTKPVGDLNGIREGDRPTSGRAVIHVNIDLDSSLDTDKLQKQLELLRRFGAI
jgi:hypothetical protein